MTIQWYVLFLMLLSLEAIAQNANPNAARPDPVTITTVVPYIALLFSAISLGLSYLAFRRTDRIRRSDVYTRLYTQYNSLGPRMELIGEWIRDKCGESINTLTEADIRREYRRYLDALRSTGKNPKSDLLELARRAVKNWFIECWHAYNKHEDLTREQLGHLITKDRTEIMWYSFIMTREQTDYWKRLSHDPASRNSSDEADFIGLANAGFEPPGKLG
jgi:hypothetical protein